jgi:hypothetical protein
MAEPIADITDAYAFPSPEVPGRLVLVMNTLPFAPPSARFSDGLIYRFRLRPVAAPARDDLAPFAVAAEEFTFDCVFSPPLNGDGARGPSQDGTCTTAAVRRSPSAWTTSGAARRTAFESSPGRAGTRSSWTPPRR